MASLSEKLAKLADTSPVFHDPEQDTLDLTVAKLAEKDEKDDGLNISTRSSLRTKSTALLDEDDSKYSGKRTSRKKLRNDEFSDDEIDSLALDALKEAIESDDSEQSGDDDEEEDDDDEEEDDDDDEEIDTDSGDDKEAVENFKTKIQQAKKEFSFEGDGDYGKYGEDDQEVEDDDDEGDDDEEDDDDDDEEMSDEDDDVQEEKKMIKSDKDGKESDIKQFSMPAAASGEVEKGKHAKNQLGIWDSLLETRIKLQKTVSSINQLPQPSIWSLFNKLGGENFNNLATEAQCELRTLLEKLVQLQTLLLLQNPATKQIVSDKNQQQHTRKDDEDDIKMNIEDDEEITSDEEDGQANKSISKKPAPQLVMGAKRKIPLDEYPEFLAKRHTDFQTYRNDTITKWNSKTQLVSGKIKGKGFGAFNQSVLKQIQQIMSDKERLIRRTQLKRSDYRVLGTTEEHRPEEQELPPDDVEMDRPTAAPVNDYDVEIFDDSDFYHHMLREFIDRKSSEINDPLALGRQWLEVQKSRTKVKRHVDNKASKGRKLRYNVHSKLVNFMAPIDNSPWTDEARDDLYKSLFGQKVKLPDGSDESSKGR